MFLLYRKLPVHAFRPVVNGFSIKERVIWLELVGLPCCAWNDVAGEVCFIEDDGDAPLAVKRVCIKTGKPFLIQDMIKVVAQGVEYEVVVREIANWEPNIMKEGEIGSDIPDLLGGEEEAACFDDDVNEFINVENDDKVDEGHENSFRMDNTPTNGVRGAGFVDRKGRFFQTNNKRKGDGPVDGRSCMPNVAVTRGIAENKCNPMMPTTAMENGCELHGDSAHLVDIVDGDGVAESPSHPPDQSSTSHGSSKILKKKVLVVVDIENVLKQYFEMGGLLGYDMETNKEQVKKILSSIGVVQALCLQFGVSFWVYKKQEWHKLIFSGSEVCGVIIDSILLVAVLGVDRVVFFLCGTRMCLPKLVLLVLVMWLLWEACGFRLILIVLWLIFMLLKI
uniref:DUF4283 domain-containing protein n=1 Tax=Lactuca sativa TaxID=4236 RepID=A0A9R1VVK9_LACSA|nr:hypothetical protein LSAT_V11C400215910 [Lactuca sativa]